jgi:endoglucanase
MTRGFVSTAASRAVAFIAAVCVSTALATNVAAGQAGSPPVPLIRVAGNRLVGPGGEAVTLRGVSFSDPDKLAREGHWNRALFEAVRTRWNANVVRLPVHPSAWRARGEDAYLTLLDSALSWAEQTSLYVIIDWHTIGNLRTELFQHPMYNTTKTETLRFWQSIAARYGKRPVVAFYELFNEPTRFNGTLGRITWDDFKGYMEEIIYMMRAYGAQGIPLVAGFDWAYDLTEPAAHPIDAPAVAYVTHPYPQKRPQPWEEHWQADWGFMAERYPVVVTEFGFMSAQDRGAHIPVMADTTYGHAIIDFLETRGMSWVAWVFDPDWSPQLIEGWDFTPTSEGRFFRQKMMELNPRPGR